MSICPYTWMKKFITHSTSSSVAANSLRVLVTKNNEKRVDVFLPANSAKWLISLIPDDVLTKIRNENIPIDDIENFLKTREILVKQTIFEVNDVADNVQRSVKVWLE